MLSFASAVRMPDEFGGVGGEGRGERGERGEVKKKEDGREKITIIKK